MKIKEAERFWKHVINTMNDGLMLISLNGAITMVNQAFEQMTGYASEEVVGHPCTLLGCDACEKIINNDTEGWCKLLAGIDGDMKRCRCLIQKKDGGRLQILKNASMLKDESGNNIGVVETLTDISEMDRLEEKLARLSRMLETEGLGHIIGKSVVMQRVFDVMRRAAKSDAPVIIYGESGTGKELVAQAIHDLGPRKNKPFVQFNCAALNESLIESELFGHAKGAFTGANEQRLGRFEVAVGGDIFLDEIGDVPPSVQVKLLRVLESKKIERVGENNPIPVDVRIISATNKNLHDLIQEKKFRDDLFFRINVLPIYLPPLRERREDLPLLVREFIGRLVKKTGKEISGVDHTAMDMLMKYSWPGNIRELRSALDYAFVISDGGPIKAEHLPPDIGCSAISSKSLVPGKRINAGFIQEVNENENGMKSGLENSEKEILIKVLKQTGGNQSQAAKILGINRVTVWNRLKKHRIELKKIIDV